MKHSEFKLNERFNCGGDVWLCTDVGTRTIAAICLSMCGQNDWARSLPEEHQKRAWSKSPPEIDPSWLTGPPYAVQEFVFDEDDMLGCDVCDPEANK